MKTIEQLDAEIACCQHAVDAVKSRLRHQDAMRALTVADLERQKERLIKAQRAREFASDPKPAKERPTRHVSAESKPEGRKPELGRISDVKVRDGAIAVGVERHT